MIELLTPARVGWAVGIAFLTLLIRFVQQLLWHRRLVKGLPGPPHSLLWGHLRSFGEVAKDQPTDAAPQTFPLLAKERFNLGDYFYLDLFPFGPTSLMVLDTDIAKQCTVKQSLPKHHRVKDFMMVVAGHGDLVSSEGAEWRKWRNAFNPGFNTTHLMSFVPTFVDECLTFCDIMTKHAKNDVLFRMEQATTRLTVDIIGKVVMDVNLNTQHERNEMVDALMTKMRWMSLSKFDNPLDLLDFRRPIVQAYLTWKVNRYIGKVLEERFATRAERVNSKTIIDLALEVYLKEVKGTTGDTSKIKKLDPEFKSAAMANLKTFLFAGHDTTSSTISYLYYYMSKNPNMLARLRKEHDDVFGPDASTVAQQLKDSPRLLNKLEYTLATIREVLRMQPPASTLRSGVKGVFLRDPKTGEALPTENFMVWVVNTGLHRNAKYWPEPHVFRPERHLANSDDTSSNYNSKDAWIGFSQGPRNCIGQELAMIETKVIVAMTIRTFDFEAAFNELDKLKGDGSGYPSDSSGVQEQFGDEAYQIQLGSAKPREGMPCRIRLRSQS